MQRRTLLSLAAGLAGTRWANAVDADAAAAQAVTSLAASWRGPSHGDQLRLGVLDLRWAQRQVTQRWSLALPGRAHGLLVHADGSVVAMAARPGTWLLRCDVQGRVQQQLSIDDEADGHRLDGHALFSADGHWLFTAQSDPQGRGWLAVRELRSLRLQDRWPTHGVDPHHLLLHASGDVMLAHGGIRRTADGRKHDLPSMDSSLVRLNGRTGAMQGRWRLADRRLSLRHLAWARPDDGSAPMLGVALQAEHDAPHDRAGAPLPGRVALP